MAVISEPYTQYNIKNILVANNLTDDGVRVLTYKKLPKLTSFRICNNIYNIKLMIELKIVDSKILLSN